MSERASQLKSALSNDERRAAQEENALESHDGICSGLCPYPDYQQSGLSWMPHIPSHWNVYRAKTLFTKMERPVGPEDEVVTCFRDGVVTLRKNRRLRGFTESFFEHGYQGIRNGDLVIHAMDAFAGAVGVSDSDGKGTPVYAVCQPRAGVNPHYYASIVREMARAGSILALARGIRERSTDFRYDAFGAQQVPYPPALEQDKIVKFLDFANRRIERAIKAKYKVITLLREQARVIIDQAASHGLDAGVPLQKSASKWLQPVPMYWKRWRAKDIYREIDERSATGNEELLSVSHITGVTPRSQKNITMFKAASYVGQKLCRPGDLVINTMWAWMAALGVSKYTGIVSSSYGVYRPRHKDRIVAEFADLLFRTRPYVSEYTSRSTGITSSRLRLYPEQFLRIALFLPPLEEQHRIVGYIQRETTSLERAIAVADKEIALLRDYRSRLVSDVIAGKLDVRAATAQLPDDVREQFNPIHADEPEAIQEEDVALSEAVND